MENECEALPGVVYPGVRDNRSTVNTKTGYDMMIRVKPAAYPEYVIDEESAKQDAACTDSVQL